MRPYHNMLTYWSQLNTQKLEIRLQGISPTHPKSKAVVAEDEHENDVAPAYLTGPSGVLLLHRVQMGTYRTQFQGGHDPRVSYHQGVAEAAFKMHECTEYTLRA